MKSIVPIDDRCPNCGTRAGYTKAIGDHDRRPEPGHIAICMTCGSISVFKDDMTLRCPYEDELKQAMRMEEIQKAILAVAHANRRN